MCATNALSFSDGAIINRYESLDATPTLGFVYEIKMPKGISLKQTKAYVFSDLYKKYIENEENKKKIIDALLIFDSQILPDFIELISRNSKNKFNEKVIILFDVFSKNSFHPSFVRKEYKKNTAKM